MARPAPASIAVAFVVATTVTSLAQSTNRTTVRDRVDAAPAPAVDGGRRRNIRPAGDREPPVEHFLM